MNLLADTLFLLRGASAMREYQRQSHPYPNWEAAQSTYKFRGRITSRSEDGRMVYLDRGAVRIDRGVTDRIKELAEKTWASLALAYLATSVFSGFGASVSCIALGRDSSASKLLGLVGCVAFSILTFYRCKEAIYEYAKWSQADDEVIEAQRLRESFNVTHKGDFSALKALDLKGELLTCEEVRSLHERELKLWASEGKKLLKSGWFAQASQGLPENLPDREATITAIRKVSELDPNWAVASLNAIASNQFRKDFFALCPIDLDSFQYTLLEGESLSPCTEKLANCFEELQATYRNLKANQRAILEKFGVESLKSVEQFNQEVGLEALKPGPTFSLQYTSNGKVSFNGLPQAREERMKKRGKLAVSALKGSQLDGPSLEIREIEGFLSLVVDDLMPKLARFDRVNRLSQNESVSLDSKILNLMQQANSLTTTEGVRKE